MHGIGHQAKADREPRDVATGAIEVQKVGEKQVRRSRMNGCLDA